jgi:hypothetical protein
VLAQEQELKLHDQTRHDVMEAIGRMHGGAQSASAADPLRSGSDENAWMFASKPFRERETENSEPHARSEKEAYELTQQLICQSKEADPDRTMEILARKLYRCRLSFRDYYRYAHTATTSPKDVKGGHFVALVPHEPDRQRRASAQIGAQQQNSHDHRNSKMSQMQTRKRSLTDRKALSFVR